MPDIEVRNAGTIFTFTPVSNKGLEWLETYAGDAQRFGSAFIVEHRYAQEIAQAALDYGLEVE